MTDEIRTNFGRKLQAKEKSPAELRREAGFAAARARGQVTPDELEKGKVYVIPSHGGDQQYRVVSVGRKWIKARILNDTIDGSERRWNVLKYAWDGPYFLEVTE